MNQNGKSLNARRKFLRGVSILATDIFPEQRFVFCIPIILLTWLCVATSVKAQDLVISGRMTYTAYLPSGKLFGQLEEDFTCRVSIPYSTNWNIRVSPRRNSSNTNSNLFETLYTEYGNEGESIFRYEGLDQEIIQNIVKKHSNAATNIPTCSGRALILSTRIPPSEPNVYVTPVWFAYASSYYLSGKSSNRWPPLWYAPIVTTKSGDYAFACQMACQKSVPFLPTEASWMASGVYPSGFGDASKLVAYNPPYDQGFTNGSYHAGSFTNIGGLSYPTSFELKQFRPRPNGASADEVVIAAVWNGVATSFKFEEALIDYKPKMIAGLTKINDYRFEGRALKNHQYITSNQVWATAPSAVAALDKKFAGKDQRKLAQLEKETPNFSKSSKRLIVISLIVICASVFPFLALRKKLFYSA